MEIIFYFLVSTMIIVEFINIKYSNYFIEVNKLKNDKEGLNIFLRDNSIETILLSLINILYFILVLAGLFSQQWMLFLILFFLALITSKVRHIKWIRVLDSSICILILLFIVLNKFHFRLFFF